MKEIIEKNQIGIIENSENNLDFEKFLLQFKNEEDINSLKIGDLVYTDFEDISELKKKTKKFIDACSILLEDKMQKIKETGVDIEDVLEKEVMEFFKDKYNELSTNETNLHILVNNFEKIKNISYTNLGVKVVLNKD